MIYIKYSIKKILDFEMLRTLKKKLFLKKIKKDNESAINFHY